MNIELGKGEWLISPMKTNGRVGLLLQKSKLSHEVGSFGKGGEIEVQPDDVAIYFGTEASARVLQYELNHAILVFIGTIQRQIKEQPEFYSVKEPS